MPSTLVGVLLQCQLRTDACLLPHFFGATLWLRWVLLQTVKGARKRNQSSAAFVNYLSMRPKNSLLQCEEAWQNTKHTKTK